MYYRKLYQLAVAVDRILYLGVLVGVSTACVQQTDTSDKESIDAGLSGMSELTPGIDNSTVKMLDEDPDQENISGNAMTGKSEVTSDQTTGIATGSAEVDTVTNGPPEILSSPVTSPGFENIYVYPAQAYDPDGDTLSWELVTAPDGLIIESGSGLLHAINLAPGNYPVVLRVDDGKGGNAEQGFTLMVSDTPVVFSNPPQYTFSETAFRYVFSAYDPNNLKLRYSLDLGPASMRIDPDTGVLTWDAEVSGVFDIELSVANTLGKSASQSFTLTVLDKDSLTIVSKPDTQAFVSQLYKYRLSVLSEKDGEIIYSLTNGPPGMTIDADNGTVSWVPDAAGSYGVDISVMNTRGYMDTQHFDVLVHSLEEMDRIFSEIIQNVFQGLVNGDITAASQYLSAGAKQQLIPVFQALQPYMQNISDNISTPVRMTINSQAAEYITSRTLNGETRLFIITFLQNPDGEWKLHSM